MKEKLKKDRTTTTVRLPPDMHAEIKDTAERRGHAMNDEIVERLRAATDAPTLHEILRQNEKTQAMVQRIIDALSPRR